MSSLASELENVIKLLEATIPGNPNTHEREAKRLEAELRDYFEKLEQALPQDRLMEIYLRHTEVE